jgi:hypothetical protein
VRVAVAAEVTAHSSLARARTTAEAMIAFPTQTPARSTARVPRRPSVITVSIDLAVHPTGAHAVAVARKEGHQLRFALYRTASIVHGPGQRATGGDV